MMHDAMTAVCENTTVVHTRQLNWRLTTTPVHILIWTVDTGVAQFIDYLATHQPSSAALAISAQLCAWGGLGRALAYQCRG